ncbi:Hypothetical protein A7982_00675 [Minicystis rosea]|nr:Hypothetical protein A7982_00675 [Minicystis rosea]
MRTTLFLSTLFAVTLAGGAALAENPHESSHAKAPRVIERLRSRGDMVDKSYRSNDRGARAPQESGSQVAKQGQQPKQVLDKTSSRVNCSEGGVDCAAPRGAAKANGMEASAGQTTQAARSPAFLDKILGKDRTNFNEAGEDQGMSSRAVKRAWASVAARNGGGSTAAVPLAQQKQVVRTQQQASEDRMACNDAGECAMSSKAVNKVWAYDQIKKGIWKGPDLKHEPTPAEVAIQRMKAEKK